LAYEDHSLVGQSHSGYNVCISQLLGDFMLHGCIQLYAIVMELAKFLY